MVGKPHFVYSQKPENNKYCAELTFFLILSEHPDHGMVMATYKALFTLSIISV